MSGHSKWSQIKRQKGLNDVKKGHTFTKLANAITLIAKQSGNGDPNTNPHLRMAIEEGRSVNMPKENVQRAIDRGLGKLPGQIIEEVIYEAFGPAKVAFIITGITDNKMRTTSEIRNIIDRSGGSMASTAYMFDKAGEIKVVSKGGSSEDEILELIDLGAQDVEDFHESQENGSEIMKYLVYIQSPELNTMSIKITQSGYSVESAQIIFKPNLLVEVSDEEAVQKVLNFAEKLEEHDDIQYVYSNLSFPQNLSIS